MLKAQFPTTESQVKHLHQLLHGFKDQWKGYSDNCSETSTLLPGLNTSTLLNDGLEALAQFFSGNPPTTFGGVFALVQFAYACASTCHQDKSPLACGAFYQNALRWSEKIADWQDRCRFRENAQLLWPASLQGDESYSIHHTSDLEVSLASGAVISSCVHFLDGKV